MKGSNFEVIRKAFFRRAPVTIAGVVGLTVVTSVLYDVVVRPGLNSGTRALLNLVTFGSSALRDSAYEQAALDPTPIAALMVFFLVSAAPYLSVITIPLLYLLRHRSRHDGESTSSSRNPAQLPTRLSKRLLSRFGVLLVLSSLAFAFSITTMARHNQSVLIWRVFHANLRIIAPFVNSRELGQFGSDFARVTSKRDYERIDSRLAAIANKNGVQLLPHELW